MWHFGIRKKKDGSYALTEEFPKFRSYAEIGHIELYSKRELKMLINDINTIIKYKKIKKTK